MGYNNLTYGIINGRITGIIDGFEAAKQSIEKLLLTNQYDYNTYNWEYGIGLKRFIGKPLDYIQTMLPKVIKKQLSYDDRVVDVSNFKFTKVKNKLYVDFDTKTIYGSFQYNIVIDYK